jgi:hypothetical protein
VVYKTYGIKVCNLQMVLFGPLIEAVKEQQEIIEGQQMEINNQKIAFENQQLALEKQQKEIESLKQIVCADYTGEICEIL